MNSFDRMVCYVQWRQSTRVSDSLSAVDDTLTLVTSTPDCVKCTVFYGKNHSVEVFGVQINVFGSWQACTWAITTTIHRQITYRLKIL